MQSLRGKPAPKSFRLYALEYCSLEPDEQGGHLSWKSWIFWNCTKNIFSLKMFWNWEMRLIVLEIRPFTLFMSWKVLKCDFLKTFQSLIDRK